MLIGSPTNSTKILLKYKIAITSIFFTLVVPVSYALHKNIYFTVHSTNYACNFIYRIRGQVPEPPFLLCFCLDLI